MRGARAALEPMLAELVDVDLRMAWAFIPMMKTDDAASAAAVAARVSDPRVDFFLDGEHRLGRAMARTLGWRSHVAWDTYFVYGRDRRWNSGAARVDTTADPPPPDRWFHQLRDREVWEATAEAELGTRDWTAHLADRSEADPATFRTGDDLRRALVDAVVALAAVRGP